MDFDYIEPIDFHFNIQTDLDEHNSIVDIIDMFKNSLSNEFNVKKDSVIIQEVNYSNRNSDLPIDIYAIIEALQTKESFEELESRIEDGSKI